MSWDDEKLILGFFLHPTCRRGSAGHRVGVCHPNKYTRITFWPSLNHLLLSLVSGNFGANLMQVTKSIFFSTVALISSDSEIDSDTKSIGSIEQWYSDGQYVKSGLDTYTLWGQNSTVIQWWPICEFWARHLLYTESTVYWQHCPLYSLYVASEWGMTKMWVYIYIGVTDTYSTNSE